VNKTNRKKSRMNKSPELKVVISYPFRAQGVGAQLPAYPAYLVSTPAALHHIVDDIAVTDEKKVRHPTTTIKKRQAKFRCI